MITSFEVGSVFRIIDEASPVMRNLTRQATALTDAIARTEKALISLGQKGRGALAPLLGELQSVRAEMTPINAGFTSMSRRMATAERNANAMAAALQRVAQAGTAAAAASVPSFGGAAAGIRRGGIYNRAPARRGGFHLGEGLSVPLTGGMRGYVRGHGARETTALLGAGLIADALLQDMIQEKETFQVRWHAGLEPTDDNKNEIRKILQKEAAESGISFRELGEAATEEARLLKVTPKGAMAVLPELLRGAALEALVKNVSVGSAMEAQVGLTLMTGKDDPEELKKMMPFLSFLSTLNPAKPKQMVRALSYAMPILESALGMDPSYVMEESTAMARAGAWSTKAGTWVRSAFEHMLPPDPKLNPRAYKFKYPSYRALGLIDATGRPIFDPANPDEALRIERQHAASLSTQERITAEKIVFEEQGARGLDILNQPTVMAQVAEMNKQFPNWTQQYRTFFDEYRAQSPMQQTRTTYQEFNNLLADIGKTAMPPVVVGLKAIDAVLRTLANVLPSGEIPKPAANAGIWERFSAWRKGLGKALGTGMVEGAVVAAPVSLFALFTGLGAPAIPWIETGGAVAGGAYEGFQYLTGGGGLTTPAHAGTLSPAARVSAEFGALGGSRQEVHVVIEAKTTDDTEDLAHKVAHYLSQLISRATEHNQGGAEGTLSSPYTSGGGP